LKLRRYKRVAWGNNQNNPSQIQFCLPAGNAPLLIDNTRPLWSCTLCITHIGTEWRSLQKIIILILEGTTAGKLSDSSIWIEIPQPLDDFADIVHVVAPVSVFYCILEQAKTLRCAGRIIWGDSGIKPFSLMRVKRFILSCCKEKRYTGTSAIICIKSGE